MGDSAGFPGFDGRAADGRASYRVLLCGSNYGRTYLPAIEGSAGRFRCAGLFARGSERSRRLAASLDVPLYRRVGDLPAGAFEVAVVALPRAASGVADELLRRGVHVLLEHPRRADDLRSAHAAADTGGAAVHVNGHFTDLPAPRAFIDELARRRPGGGGRHSEGEVRHLEIVCQDRALYAALDILDAALPLDDLQIAAARPLGEFRSLDLLLGDPPTGGPLAVRLDVQAPPDAADGSPRYVVDVAITARLRGGSVTLQSLAGPAVWKVGLAQAAPSDGALWRSLSPAPSLDELRRQRVEANLEALERLASAVETGRDDALVGRPRTLRVADAWGRIGDALKGPP
ncbi:MAG: Gfo/Idh/MocA family oxidoreductase [Acidobacteriota bacterium]